VPVKLDQSVPRYEVPTLCNHHGLSKCTSSACRLLVGLGGGSSRCTDLSAEPGTPCPGATHSATSPALLGSAVSLLVHQTAEMVWVKNAHSVVGFCLVSPSELLAVVSVLM